MKNITFVDAQHMRLRHPDTFWAPSKEELDDIKPGDYVKVCVNEWKERFWVEVIQVDNDILTVRVANDLLHPEASKYGDELTVNKCNIYDID